jgi:hypothetical protein
MSKTDNKSKKYYMRLAMLKAHQDWMRERGNSIDGYAKFYVNRSLNEAIGLYNADRAERSKAVNALAKLM